MDKSMNRAEILRFAKDTRNTDAEYLFASSPTSCVLRHPDNRKWYAVFLEVPRRRMGLPGEGLVDVLDVKCGPILMGSLLPKPGFRPGYHMNKTAWVSILLDGSVPREEILNLLGISWQLTGPKRKNAAQPQ